MTLATRISLFFLATLAVVLTGFSAALYTMAAVYLDRQTTARLEAALQSLTAAAEIENGRLEWEPHNRSIQIDDGRDDATRLSWRVTDEAGRWIDGSSDTRGATPAWAGPTAASTAGDSPAVGESADGESRLARVMIAAPDSTGGAANSTAVRHARRAFIIEAAVPLGPVRALLAKLAGAAAVLSATLWLLAALAGRVICRRALGPLTAMASAARATTGDVLARRLPEPNTRDECQDLARAFNDLLARAEEAYERQRQFAGNASHQLRTPLAAILGQIEVALRRERPADEYRRVLEGLHQRAGEMRQLVEMLLFLARADGEAQLPDLELLELGPWLRECLDDWSAHPRADDLQLELNGNPRWCRLHRPLAAQLIGNLIDNACKHSLPGTPIVVRLTDDPNSVRIEVEDHGEGIAPSELPHIFEPFYRAQVAQNRGLPGVGLGLAVAKRIAAALGGELRVESHFGRGARFSVILRRSAPEDGRHLPKTRPHLEPQHSVDSTQSLGANSISQGIVCPQSAGRHLPSEFVKVPVGHAPVHELGKAHDVAAMPQVASKEISGVDLSDRDQ
jgi:two-component system OmpR family sensor kinase